MDDGFPTFFVLEKSVGSFFDTVTPDGENNSVASFEGKEGTEVEASQCRNAVFVKDILVHVFPRDPSGDVQAVVIRHVSAFLVLLVCHPSGEVRLTIVVKEAG